MNKKVVQMKLWKNIRIVRLQIDKVQIADMWGQVRLRHFLGQALRLEKARGPRSAACIY